MKQIYYTQEGTPYILKTSTYFNPAYLLIAPNRLIPVVMVNFPTGYSTSNFGSFQVSTGKKIVPVSYSFSAVVDIVLEPVSTVDVGSVYWVAQNGNQAGTVFTTDIKSKQVLAKLYPLANRVYYSNNLNYNYSLAYNQAVLSDNDFLEANNPLGIAFFEKLSYCMTASGDYSGIVPGGTYKVAGTFTYFEML